MITSFPELQVRGAVGAVCIRQALGRPKVRGVPLGGQSQAEVIGIDLG